MMTEAEPPASSRLRRRSFFENMEADGAQPDAVSLDLASAAGGTGGAAATTAVVGGGGSAVLPLLDEPGDADPSPAEASAPPPTTTAALTGFGELLRRARAFLALQLQLWRLLLLTRIPMLARVATACENQWERAQALGARLLLCRRRRDGSDAGGSPAKHWAYPTHWLTLAAATLVLAQLATAWRFQTLPMDLRVDECAFRERLLAASYTGGGPPASTSAQSAALRVLERRFEQQYGYQARPPRSHQRLPWTCMAVVPTAPGDSALARQLAFFWPRAEVVDPREPVQRSSRLQVVLGASPAAAHTAGEHAGVVAALLPLEAFRRGLFARRFPDLVLVKTEFALRQMLRFREERAEERAAGLAVGVEGGGGGGDAQRDDDALSWSQFGVLLLKTTVPDVYDRRVRKDWDAFLHVVVRSEQDKKEQFTEELLALWLAHPDWPTLHVRFASSPGLCQSFQLLLSSLAARDQDAQNADRLETEAELADRPDAWEDDEDFDWDDQAERDGRRPQQQSRKPRKPNVDLVCDAEANSPQEILRLKNAIGLHVFPVPPEVEAYEELALESLAAGAVVLTFDTPVMQEWVPDACGVRVGSFELASPTAAGELLSTGERVVVGGDQAAAMDAEALGSAADEEKNGQAGTATGEMRLPVAHVAPSDIEQGVARLLALDRVSRVAAGRAARLHYLALRTHYLSALAALDVAVCDDDDEGEGGALPSEIGAHRRRKVAVETLRTFLY